MIIFILIFFRIWYNYIKKDSFNTNQYIIKNNTFKSNLNFIKTNNTYTNNINHKNHINNNITTNYILEFYKAKLFNTINKNINYIENIK